MSSLEGLNLYHLKVVGHYDPMKYCQFFCSNILKVYLKNMLGGGSDMGFRQIYVLVLRVK